MILLPISLPYFVKLGRCFANGALIMFEAAARAIFTKGYARLPESPGRFFVMKSIARTLFVPAPLVDFDRRPSVLE
jgi:hypothetical protein